MFTLNFYAWRRKRSSPWLRHFNNRLLFLYNNFRDFPKGLEKNHYVVCQAVRFYDIPSLTVKRKRNLAKKGGIEQLLNSGPSFWTSTEEHWKYCLLLDLHEGVWHKCRDLSKLFQLLSFRFLAGNAFFISIPPGERHFQCFSVFHIYLKMRRRVIKVFFF
jgi:hypothetical protein